MSISGISSFGLASAYNFSQLTPSQIRSAATALENNGTLTTDEAQELTGLGSESSFSPVNGDTSDNSWESIKLNVFSSLEDKITVGEMENLGQEGTQILATDKSLLQKLSSYASQYAETAASGTLVNQSA